MKTQFPTHLCVVTALFLAIQGMSGAADATRRVVSLDGTWDVGEGKMDAPPAAFDHKVPVPGLLDMATPPFVEAGPKVAMRSSHPQKDPKRDAFWYRRSFKIDGPVPDVATLKIGKAMFGTRVLLNGTPLGDHLPCFTPALVDAKNALKSGDNELVIRVGADRDALNGKAQSGHDGEKSRYIPGIYDSVELILSGTPNIMNVQAVPDIDKKSVTIHSWLKYSGAPTAEKLHITIREVATQRVAGENYCEIPADASKYEHTGQVTISLPYCHLWSPEDPFLYEVEVKGTADVYTTRFGMRSFRMDPATGRAMLNGKPYFMRGSNITIYRFFEDPDRGNLPWTEEWVRKLHKKVKDMHWNSLRYCIGFPPELWYRIADEEGILIQDEFPVWYCMAKPGQLDADELTKEYTEWMQERWNHPCVVLWDACNETFSPETGKALHRVRGLDFSKRPWDNGWGVPDQAGDTDEAHPYHFIFGPDQPFRMKQIANDPGTKAGLLIAQPFAEEKLKRKNPVIINEYGGLWLNRDGTPTTLSAPVYEYLLGPAATKAQLNMTYARNMAAITEFFRAHRQAAAVLHFTALGYSRPDGQTSDHWTDVKTLEWNPEFYKYVRDAFAPVGVMLDVWAEEYPGGTTQDFPVMVTNDLNKPWHDAVSLKVTQGGKTVFEKKLAAKVDALGTARIMFNVPIPQQTGNYQAEVMLLDESVGQVRSLRDFAVVAPEVLKARGLAYGKSAKASSSARKDDFFTFAAGGAVDERPYTWWKSDGDDPQWLAVDLGETQKISRVELVWNAAYGKSYVIQRSNDGEHWTDVFKSANGMGGTDTCRFEPVKTRWVRYYGVKAATSNGYSLREFRVFP